jgi:methylated-DNA-protein-cysteine methyltransferase-like protein
MASSEMTEHVAQLYRSIYAVVRRIPTGRVATYGQVAELAGIPGGGRVAGAAMKISTPADRLPWQRVIGKASKNRGRIAIHDPVGAAVQRQLLGDEGVAIGDTGLIPLERYGWLPAEALARNKRGGGTKRGAARSGGKRDTARSGGRRSRVEPTPGITTGSGRAASPRRPPRSGSKRRASSSRR